MAQSQGVTEHKNLNEKIEHYQPPADEMAMLSFHKARIQKAKEVRTQPFRHFDNLTFVQDYYSNRDATNSYLRPKKNDDEVRVVGGTTEKRLESLVNEMLSLNTSHEIQVYDKDDKEVEQLGQVIGDVVTRTNQMEHDDDVRTDAIWGLVSQRCVFVEDIYEEKGVMGSTIGMAKKRVRTSLEVLIGDVTQPIYKFQEQPYIVIYERMSYWNAKLIYGDRKNWKHVRPGANLSDDVYGTDATFRVGILQTDEVEVCKYKSTVDNEEQTYVNGVPMDEVGQEMRTKNCLGQPRYNLSVSSARQMDHHFFYGRPITASMKYLQALNDETVRNIIRKFRQAIEPPKAVKRTNKVYSRDIFNAGSMTYGLDADEIKNLVEHNGVTESELRVLEMIKEMQDEFSSRSNTQLGISSDRKETATEIIQKQQQAVKMLGLLIIAWERLVRDMTEQRIYTIFENMMDSNEKHIVGDKIEDAYRTFTLADQVLDNGKIGKKIIEFKGTDMTEEEHTGIMDWEDEQEKQGKNVRYTALNVSKLRSIPLFFYVSTTSKPKESDDLHKLMFQDTIAQTASLMQFGLQPNAGKIGEEFERKWKVKDWWSQAPAPQPLEEAMAGQGVAGDLTAGFNQKKPQKPNPTPTKALNSTQ